MFHFDPLIVAAVLFVSIPLVVVALNRSGKRTHLT